MARKPKYESVEQIEGLIEAYFESCKGEILRDEDGRIVFNQKDGTPVWVGRKPPTIPGLALALAAQLPVDRVALLGGSPFGAVRTDGGAIGRARELARVDAFARRNLALVVAEILLVNVPDDERRKLIRGLGRGADVHRSEGTVDPAALLEPWTE